MGMCHVLLVTRSELILLEISHGPRRSSAPFSAGTVGSALLAGSGILRRRDGDRSRMFDGHALAYSMLLTSSPRPTTLTSPPGHRRVQDGRAG
eukprot:466090-Hanusia_phi.AAC.1